MIIHRNHLDKHGAHGELYILSIIIIIHFLPIIIISVGKTRTCWGFPQTTGQKCCSPETVKVIPNLKPPSAPSMCLTPTFMVPIKKELGSAIPSSDCVLRVGAAFSRGEFGASLQCLVISTALNPAEICGYF